MIADITDTTSQLPAETIALIDRLLQFIADRENIPDNAELSVNFVDEKTIQSLNLEYRGLDEPTDVISFALQEVTEGELAIQADEQMPLILGDIIISIEQAKDQAIAYNHSLERELGFLTVHGFLHLIGYDHLTKADEEIMFNKQNQLLQAFGLERE